MTPLAESAIKHYIEAHPELESRIPDLEDLFSSWDPEDKYMSLDVHSGWFDLIIATHKSLKLVQPNYMIHQIKQKFGALRYYTNLHFGHSYDPAEFTFASIVTYAEYKSSRICENCGENGHKWNVGTRGFFGWYHTFCDPCELKYAVEHMTKYQTNPLLEDTVEHWEKYRDELVSAIDRREQARLRLQNGA